MPYLSDKDVEEELKRFWKDHAFYKSLVDGDYYELKDFIRTIRAKDREAVKEIIENGLKDISLQDGAICPKCRTVFLILKNDAKSNFDINTHCLRGCRDSENILEPQPLMTGEQFMKFEFISLLHSLDNLSKE